MAWHQTPDEIPATRRCYQLSIPDDPEIISAVIGTLGELADSGHWSYIGEVTPDEIAEAMRDMIGEMIESECEEPMTEIGLQTRVSLWHRWAQIDLPGAGLLAVQDATQMFGHYVRQNPGALGDTTHQQVWLAAGQYQMRVLYFRNTTSGKLTIQVVKQPELTFVVPINQVDLRGALLANQVLEASFTVATSGEYYVYTICQATTAVPASYFLPLTKIEIWRTGD